MLSLGTGLFLSGSNTLTQLDIFEWSNYDKELPKYIFEKLQDKRENAWYNIFLGIGILVGSYLFLMYIFKKYGKIKKS